MRDRHYRGNRKSPWVEDLLVRREREVTITIPVGILQVLGYYYAGSASMYFTLMVPTTLGWGDVVTYPIARWFYGQVTLLAPIMAALLWLLFATVIGLVVLWLLKGTLSLLKAIIEDHTKK